MKRRTIRKIFWMIISVVVIFSFVVLPLLRYGL